jgi:hypothetical protein
LQHQRERGRIDGALQAQVRLADCELDDARRRAPCVGDRCRRGRRGGERHRQEVARIGSGDRWDIAKLPAQGEDLIGVDTVPARHPRDRGAGAQRLCHDGAFELIRMVAIGAAFARPNDWLNYCVHN